MENITNLNKYKIAKSQEICGMSLPRACAIVNTWESELWSEYDRAMAAYFVLFEMVTRNGISKDKLVEVGKWLWNQHYEFTN